MKLPRRKIDRASARFWKLVENGEIQAALAHFDAALAGYHDGVNKALRTTYHLYRWFEYRDDADVRALELLIEGEPRTSQVVRALYTLGVQRRQWTLAQSLRARNASQPIPAAQGPREDAHLQLEALALAIRETFVPGNETQRATAIQRTLPAPSALNGKLLHIRDLLFTWSMLTLGQHEAIFDDDRLLQSVQISEGSNFRVAAIFAWGQRALSQGDTAQAVRALKLLKSAVAGPRLNDIIMTWCVTALQENQPVLDFLTGAPEVQAVLADSPEVALLIALASFQAGRLAQGRAALDEIDAEGEFGAQVLFLRALALLADLPTTSSDEENAVHNRARWHTLREQLFQTANTLAQMPVDTAWRGHLLHGLIAYVDNSATLSPDQLEAFNAAIDEVPDTSRQRLKDIEAVLMTRSQATDQAIEYLQRHDIALLRQLYEKVLFPLGDAIPPLVRATVIMSLWDADHRFDPLPELRRIRRDPETEALLDRCVTQVELYNTLKHLTTLCQHVRQPDLLAGGLPALGGLRGSEDGAYQSELAAAVVLLAQGEWAAALDMLPAGDSPAADYVRFYAAWQLNDLQTCNAIRQRGDNPFLTRYDHLDAGLDARMFIDVLESGSEEEIESTLVQRRFALVDAQDQGTIDRLAGFAVFLLEASQTRAATRLIASLRQQADRLDNFTPDSYLDWLLTFLEALAAGQGGRYSAVLDLVDNFITHPYQPTKRAAGRLTDWARLFRLQAELASATHAGADFKLRWPAARRSLLTQASELAGSAALQAYGALIVGLVSYLSADSLIDDTIIENLMRARQTLAINRGARFIEDVLAQLRWRKTVISDYWQSLSNSAFKDSHHIFQSEIAPAFGERVPHSIQFVQVVVDWTAQQITAAEALRRLSVLEDEAPELAGEQLVAQAREYIVDGDNVRQFTKLVVEKDYDGIIEFTQRGQWAESMPVPVAIALLHAYYKKKMMEETENLARNIRSQRLAGWVHDYGYLILGYVLYDKESYDEAAEAFGSTRTSNLLGHNTDKYWRIAHFSRGLQLLKNDQKKEAFDSFQLSLQGNGGEEDNLKFIALFMHFGLRNVEARNGNRALQAFDLMAESLDAIGDGDDPERLEQRVLAQTGRLLCQALLEQEKPEDIITGEMFMALLPQVQAMQEKLSGPNMVRALYLERMLRRMAVVQELRRQRLLDKRKRTNKTALCQFLTEQLERLAALQEGLREIDPTVPMLQCALELYLKDKPDPQALDGYIQMFTQLGKGGYNTRALKEMEKRIHELRENARKEAKAIFDTLDTYIVRGGIPAPQAEALLMQPEVAELYQLNRGYVPRDVGEMPRQSDFDLLEARLQALLQSLDGDEFKDDPEFAKLADKLKQELARLQKARDQLFKAERSILDRLAAKLREQTLQ